MSSYYVTKFAVKAKNIFVHFDLNPAFYKVNPCNFDIILEIKNIIITIFKYQWTKKKQWDTARSPDKNNKQQTNKAKQNKTIQYKKNKTKHKKQQKDKVFN